ncbi:MAG: hypothetical protein RLZZ237_2166 [Pseudomonadota bacterium]|jgi:pimeloyl-ACP methyl ester carboxylesterase
MIARILKGLMLLQLLAVLGLAWLLQQLPVAPWLALLLALAVVLAARAVLVLHHFWQSRRFGSPVPPAFRLDAAGAVRLFFGELQAGLWTSSWGMLRPRLTPQDVKASSSLPVLLIHGYVCNRGYWTQLSRRLAQAGIAHDAVDLEPIGAGIDDFLPQVHGAVQALCTRSGAQQVIIVAHSMGGLVARAYLRQYGEQRIAHVITVGTPHHGTALANLGLGRNARQMSRPHGQPHPWLVQLAAGERAEARARFTSIYSHHDNIVAPQDSACLPGARNLAFGGIGHVALASDVRILARVMEEITIVSEVANSVLNAHSR